MAQLTHAGETTSQPIAAGPEVVAHAGDVIYEDAGVVHSARNAGDTPLVLLHHLNHNKELHDRVIELSVSL